MEDKSLPGLNIVALEFMSPLPQKVAIVGNQVLATDEVKVKSVLDQVGLQSHAWNDHGKAGRAFELCRREAT